MPPLAALRPSFDVLSGPPLLLVDLAAIKIVLFKELIIRDQENLIPKNFMIAIAVQVRFFNTN